MKRRALSTLCIILGLTTKAWAQDQSVTTAVNTTATSAISAKKEKSKFTADWRLRLAGTDFHDDQSQSKYVDFRLDVRSKYLLTESLTLDLQPSIRMVSGQNQTIDGADKMENKILLNQAAAHYTPVEWFRLSAGALNERAIHTSLLIDELAFPAARTTALIKSGIFEMGFYLETAIPTSTSLSTNTKDLEPTPSLNTAALIWKFQSNKETFWKTGVSYFMYNNLPSAVAQQSLLLGNTVQNVSDAQYNFVYQFQGEEFGTEIQVPVFKYVDFVGQAQYIHNDKAPSEDATGYLALAGAKIHMTHNMDWTLKGMYFSIAPEAAVAYFNARGFETNRVGYGAETLFSFKKEGFNVGLQYKDAEVMYENPVQSREKQFILKLETFYADI
ncbi:MAG TPA: hypothetical protein VF412_16140 [Bdellovibrio sp.]|uniref:hypothetical protein n=1 Tax=Bdellovibrio sp. TaxID=28201 RepID=UPI002EF9AF8E